MNKQSEIKVRYLDENCIVILGHYQTDKNRIAMMLEIADGQTEGKQMSVVSTNLPDHMESDEIAVQINDYKRELYDILIQQAILIDTGRIASSGYNTYAICKINFEVNQPFVS